MKTKIKILSLLLAAAFVLPCFAGCSDVPPAENPSESAPESEFFPELSKEELNGIKEKIEAHIAKKWKEAQNGT